MKRLPKAASQVIDRQKEFTFTFDGTEYRAYEGDTIASALSAAGVKTLGRSFKYHRPRGLLCVSGDCPNCLVRVGGEPNVRSCKRLVSQGMRVHSQNAWPSLNFDMMSLIQLIGRFLPVGFYYKAFMRPKRLWPWYEKVLRHIAGLGKVDPDVRPGYFDKVYKHPDVAVIGGGLAGLRAALSAANQGAQVTLIDENPVLGGHLRYTTHSVNQKPGYLYAEQLAGEVSDHANIEVLTDTLAFGMYDGNWIGARQKNRLIKLRSKSVVIACGAYENTLVFENNDLPGIILAAGVSRLLHLWGVKPGDRAVLVSANQRGLLTAIDLLEAGVQVIAVAELRSDPEVPLVNRLRSAGVEVLRNVTVSKALGKGHIQGVVLRSHRDDKLHEFNCDLLVLATGYSPANGLLFQAGGLLTWDESINEYIPTNLPETFFAAGEVTGSHENNLIESEGEFAGLQAAQAAGFAGDALGKQVENLKTIVQQQRNSRLPWTPPQTLLPEGKKDFVCFCEDVTQKDVRHSVEEGYDSVELLKRYSTISMGPCQGKMCNMHAMRLVAHFNEQPILETGTTTSRPPVRPIPMGALGGRLLEPVRVTPMHAWHLEHGASMMNAGQWKRPEHYGDPHAEVRAVRQSVGLIDVSTLGKIHLHGFGVPDLLENLYTNRWQKLSVGRVRYGLMVSEEGVVLDDGVTTRIADDFYYMTTTSSGAQTVYEWIEWWLQSGWRYDVHVLNATELRAAMNLTGPRARDVLAKVVEDVDISNNGFPYMNIRQGIIAGVPGLLMRIGFTGELGYEIHVPSGYGYHVWSALMKAGEEFGIRPFGVEAQRVLRLEKGHIIVGQDTDALMTPFEANLDWVVKLDKDDFLGKPSLVISDQQPRTKRLVGFEVPDGTLPEEANQIVREVDGPRSLEIIGRVTSVRYSPTLEKVIGLCLLPDEMTMPGTEFLVRVRGELSSGRVTELPFYDAPGVRLHS